MTELLSRQTLREKFLIYERRKASLLKKKKTSIFADTHRTKTRDLNDGGCCYLDRLTSEVSMVQCKLEKKGDPMVMVDHLSND